MDDGSAISRPKRTISRYGVRHKVCGLPTRLPFRCPDVLDAPRTRRASPLLAGCPLESLPARAIQLPDKEFRFGLIRTRPNGAALPWMPLPACRHAEGTI